jgi:hypothetical protein
VLTRCYILPDAGCALFEHSGAAGGEAGYESKAALLIRAPHTTCHPSPSALWRERTEPRVKRRAVRLQALAHGLPSALLFVGATTFAVSTVIFLRIVLTAHQLPGLQEKLAQFLPFLD